MDNDPTRIRCRYPHTANSPRQTWPALAPEHARKRKRPELGPGRLRCFPFPAPVRGSAFPQNEPPKVTANARGSNTE